MSQLPLASHGHGLFAKSRLAHHVSRPRGGGYVRDRRATDFGPAAPPPTPHEVRRLLLLVTVFAQALLALVGGDFMAFTFFTARHLVEI